MSRPESEVLHRLAHGGFAALAMLAGRELDVFTPLAGGPRTANELAGALGLRPDKLRPLLYALVDCGLLTLDGDRFANTPEADRSLVRGRPAYQPPGALPEIFRSLLTTAESIATGTPRAKKDWGAMSEEELEAFLAGLHPSSVAAGRMLHKRYDFMRHRRVVDVGGGTGGVAIALAEACPELRVTTLDLPAVARIAQKYVEKAGLAGRVEARGANVLRDPLGGPYDAAVLKVFLQVLGPDDCRRALGNVAAVLRSGGEVYILGHVLDDSRLAPPVAVQFNLFLLTAYDTGAAYTASEYRAWLEAAGFGGMARTVFADGSSLLVARKGGGA